MSAGPASPRASRRRSPAGTTTARCAARPRRWSGCLLQVRGSRGGAPDPTLSLQIPLLCTTTASSSDPFLSGHLQLSANRLQEYSPGNGRACGTFCSQTFHGSLVFAQQRQTPPQAWRTFGFSARLPPASPASSLSTTRPPRPSAQSPQGAACPEPRLPRGELCVRQSEEGLPAAPWLVADSTHPRGPERPPLGPQFQPGGLMCG